jgi:hypothetical protein
VAVPVVAAGTVALVAGSIWLGRTGQTASKAGDTLRQSGQSARKPGHVGPKPVASPPNFGSLAPPRSFAWPARADASWYVVTIYRNGQRLFRTRTSAPRLRLPEGFGFAPGRYRWRVVPIGADGRPRAPLVDSGFVVKTPGR